MNRPVGDDEVFGVMILYNRRIFLTHISQWHETNMFVNKVIGNETIEPEKASVERRMGTA